MNGSTSVTVVIDVFRAFTTACYVLDQQPASYKLTTKSSVIERLAKDLLNPVLVGKAEKGFDYLVYHIPNSPTRFSELELSGRDVLHRTQAGAKGILQSKDADVTLAAGFVNAEATVDYIHTLINPEVHIVPMGHEGQTPSLEDDVCASYIEARLQGKELKIGAFTETIKNGPGSYFFYEDQWQYPREDFERCLQTKRFNFAIKAEVKDDYAVLTRCD